MIRKFLFAFVLFFCAFGLSRISAQVTTGTITGTVKESNGQSLTGAAVKAVHTPTGSVYSTTSKSNGQFTLPNLRVGGPYQVTIQYIGFSAKTFDDIYVPLGTPLTVDAILTGGTTELGNVQVSAKSKGAIISSQRNGTATYISSQQLQTLPSINRSVQDFARLMPQAKVGNGGKDGTPTGISFGGQNNRYNQFSIDGVNATDGFGLGSTGTNGGQANVNPIAMEAIQEMQIVMAPYDVTQGGFTGGGINAITKSGSNTFHGSIYGQYQNQNFVGKSASYDSGINRNSYGSFKNYTFGASLGGPIIKNKLFFYADVERFKKSTPLAYDPTQPGSGSKVNPDTLNYIRQYLLKNYGYDAGTYGAINNNNQSTSVFARLDWNIDEKSKLVFRFNHVDGTLDVLSRSATSAIFSNSGYGFSDKNNSAVAELNTAFSSNASNVLRLTYTSVRDARTTSAFPSVTIYNYNPASAASITYNIGSDYSSAVNGLNQDIYTLTDNFTLYKGKHTLTFGTDNLLYNSKNLFLQNYYGSYTYGSSGTNTTNINNFVNNAYPTSYQIGYSTSSNPADKAPADLHAAQFSLYGQDVWAATDRFKLTYGLRIDLPVFFNKPAENPAFNSAFASYGITTQQMPKANPLFSPRAGFNWDVKGDATTQLRGGAGLFTGRVPFVWISNQISNTGVASQSVTINSASAIAAANIKLVDDPTKPHLGAYVPASASTTGAVINVVDKNFKFPQVFRANLALDQKLNWWGLIGTLEAVYTKTINNANYSNLNISNNGDATVAVGPTTRPFWNKYTNTTYGNVLYLTNTSKGYGLNFTAQIQKPASKGWAGSIAYTYGHSTSLNDLTSSVAQSNWRAPLVVNGLNHPDVATSNFNMGSRIVGFISKEFKYAKNFATSFTLIYTGQSGQRFSYVYGNNLEGDYSIGSTSGSVALAYVPADATAANFVDIKNGATASQQWANFQKFVNSNNYLKDHMGQNTERNGDKQPFENHFDFRIAQDFILGHNKLQLFFDVLNVGNLLNKDWGWSYGSGSTPDGFYTLSTSLLSVVTSGAQTKDGAAATSPTTTTPAFQFNLNNFTRIKGTYRPYTVNDFTSRWNAQIGLHYSF
jgi:hypothetical protein